MGIQDLWAFVLAVLVFLALPGPGTFAVLTASGKGGVGAGLAATLGIIAGDQVLLWLAVAGVAALLKAHPTWFHAVQYVGAAYLAWIGLRLLFARGDGAAPIVRMRPGHWARQAFLITLLNPKAILFYMAFFPLFIDPATHRGLITFTSMAAIIATLTLAWCAGLSLFAHALTGAVRRRRRLARLLERAAGVLLIGFGVKLAQ